MPTEASESERQLTPDPLAQDAIRYRHPYNPAGDGGAGFAAYQQNHVGQGGGAMGAG